MAGATCAATVAAAVGAPDGVAFWLGAVVAAGAPDLDTVPAMLGVGPGRVHRGPSHSFITTGAFVVVALLMWRTGLLPVDGRLLVAWSAALLSHPLLDLVTTGPRIASRGFGIALLWPLSQRRWFLQRPVFEQDGEWLRCRSIRCLVARISPELIWLGPLCVGVAVLGLLG